jgi:hypothetical protein
MPKFFAGLIDELCISGRALSEGFLKTQSLNFRSPRDFYGVGEVNSATATNLSPVLPPLRAAATVGSASTVDAALRAYEGDSGQNKTLESLTGSGGGNSSIVSGRAQLLPSTAGTWRRIAAVKDDAATPKRSSAPIIWTVEEGETDPGGRDPPAAARTLRVPEDYPTIALAYTAAASGDHISLADGTYSSGIPTFNKSFSTSSPVIIKARSLNGAVITTKMQFPGVGHWLYQVKNTWNNATGKDAGSGAVNVMGSYFTMTRCWLTGRMGITMGDENEVHHCWVGWNRFTGHTAGNTGSSHIFLSLPEGAGNWTTQSEGPHHIYIYRNFMWDNDSSGEDHYLYFGTAKVFNNLGVVPECYVEYNLIYHVAGQPSRARGFYLKRGCIFRFNDDMAPGAGSNGFRHSRGGEIYGNTIRQDILNVNGGTQAEHAVVYGNAVGDRIRLWSAGNSSATGNVPHQAADYCELAGNRKYGAGTLTVNIGVAQGYNHDGTGYDGGTVDHVRVWSGGFAHSLVLAGSTWTDAATCDSVARIGWGVYPVTAPITLEPADVGQELDDQR